MNREGESLSTLTVSDKQAPPALLSLPQIPVLRITKTSASNSPAKEEDVGEGLDSRHGAEGEERLVLCEPASSLQGATSHPSSRKLWLQRQLEIRQQPMPFREDQVASFNF